MPHYPAAVKFPDGLIMFAEYDSVVDVMRPPLFLTETELSANWRKRYVNTGCTCGAPAEPVEILADYIGGYWWEGAACRTCCWLVAGMDIHWLAPGEQYRGSLPEDRLEEPAYGPQDRPVATGYPDWSPWPPDELYAETT